MRDPAGGNRARLRRSSVQHAPRIDRYEAPRSDVRRGRVDRSEVTHCVDDDVAAGRDEDRYRALADRDDREVRSDLSGAGDVDRREPADRAAERRQGLNVERGQRVGRCDVDRDRRGRRRNNAGRGDGKVEDGELRERPLKVARTDEVRRSRIEQANGCAECGERARL